MLKTQSGYDVSQLSIVSGLHLPCGHNRPVDRLFAVDETSVLIVVESDSKRATSKKIPEFPWIIPPADHALAIISSNGEGMNKTHAIYHRYMKQIIGFVINRYQFRLGIRADMVRISAALSVLDEW